MMTRVVNELWGSARCVCVCVCVFIYILFVMNLLPAWITFGLIEKRKETEKTEPRIYWVYCAGSTDDTYLSGK